MAKTKVDKAKEAADFEKIINQGMQWAFWGVTWLGQRWGSEKV